MKGRIEAKDKDIQSIWYFTKPYVTEYVTEYFLEDSRKGTFHLARPLFSHHLFKLHVVSIYSTQVPVLRAVHTQR